LNLWIVKKNRKNSQQINIIHFKGPLELKRIQVEVDEKCVKNRGLKKGGCGKPPWTLRMEKYEIRTLAC
jgi:hypothetical protein